MCCFISLTDLEEVPDLSGHDAQILARELELVEREDGRVRIERLLRVEPSLLRRLEPALQRWFLEGPLLALQRRPRQCEHHQHAGRSRVVDLCSQVLPRGC